MKENNMVFKKYLLPLLGCVSFVFASDPVTLDSMFQNQQGLRSITTFQTLSSGNANTFATYPDLVAVDEGKYYQDVKIFSVTQTFLYDITQKFDALVSANGSIKRKEYYDFFDGYGHQNTTEFDSLWVGGTYSFDAIDDFKPYLTLQASLYQKEHYLDSTKNTYANSYSAKLAFRNYSDPVISTLYVGTMYNRAKEIAGYKVENGNVFSAGLDFSIILSPKIALDLGAEQRYQTETKIDGVAYSNAAAISTMTIGATYSMSSKNSLSISSSIGGSSKSPDSIFSVSLWHKF
ncbi:hypothetical protein [Sulfuricurvum sp.]|uniref:hypothetical protein n=1 Tax=Sulfuricurvum sp. TaxID=2025608 RepID=UPI0026198B4C|nr:hypothetical protein [Sulfuricurvum sp.]MDD3598079.1 hypothetical protein [Sulfuricurvum sp.]MDD4885041.1 hypothetical protein [Sulfuricurvum sp.]